MVAADADDNDNENNDNNNTSNNVNNEDHEANPCKRLNMQQEGAEVQISAKIYIMPRGTFGWSLENDRERGNVSDKTYSVVRVRLSTERVLYGSMFLRGGVGRWAEAQREWGNWAGKGQRGGIWEGGGFWEGGRAKGGRKRGEYRLRK